MPLSDVAAGTHGLDLSKYALAPGTYTLYLKAIGKASLRNQMSAGVSYSVGDHPPQATLSVTPGSGIAPVTVTASTAGSSDPDGTAVTSSLDFGDGTKAVGPVATHTYAAAGNYQITATVTDPQGLSATAAATVNVAANKPPLAALALTPGSGIAPVTVTASTAGSSDPDGSVASSQIDFGDGTSAAGPTAAHAYAAPGSYTVTAKVTDNLGAISSISGTVSVTPAGVTVATPTSGSTSNSPVHVLASAASGNGISATWVYVDGVAMYKTNSASVDTSIPLSGGSHSMVVQAWDTKGTVLKAPVSLTVVATPKVVMTSPVNGARVSSPVHVVASASSGAPVSAMWIYLDSNVVYKTALAKIDTYITMPYGTHTITVKAWDATGALFKAAATVSR
jgi:PKD repeat protein